MRGHPQCLIGQRAEGREVDALELGQRGRDRRQLEMAVGRRPAMPGDVFYDRQHAAGQKPLADRAPAPRHLLRGLPEGAAADDVVPLGQAHIEELYRSILATPEVTSVQFVSKEEALVDFKGQLVDDAELLSALRANPLPNSFWIEPKAEHKSRDAMVGLAERFGHMRGVEEVRYGKEFLDKFMGDNARGLLAL